ncbi:hypothetical protein GPROT1_01749 [Gammaproteobacteria bacterium]|nr:hypothetical protein GPROT1_01749 [Gammaproteobacteria bacterium]
MTGRRGLPPAQNPVVFAPVKLFCCHEVDLPADRYWEILHHPDYEARVAAAIGLHAYEELERREEPEAVYRRIRVGVDLPDALQALLRRVARVESAGYVEEQWRSRKKREVRWRMTPGVLADRIHVEGTVRVEPRGAKRCARVLDGVVQVGIFGVGGLVERSAVAMATDAYAKGAELAVVASDEIARGERGAASRTAAGGGGESCDCG